MDLRVEHHQVLPEFRIVQHKRDVKLLYAIKTFFGHGMVVSDKSKDSLVYEYRVRKFDTLYDVIVPFFESNKLLTSKRFNFLAFRDVILMMKQQEHITEDGLSKIIAIKNRMDQFC